MSSSLNFRLRVTYFFSVDVVGVGLSGKVEAEFIICKSRFLALFAGDEKVLAEAGVLSKSRRAAFVVAIVRGDEFSEEDEQE
jgi:hypothetical protein